MRQFGLDLARCRPFWCRWNFRPVRRLDLCLLLDQFYPGIPFPELGCGEFAEFAEVEFPPEFLRRPRTARLPRPPVRPRFALSVGCPSVLIQQGFIGQDGLAVVQLAQAGVPIPTNDRLNRFGSQGGFILQLRKNPADGVSVRRCQFGGSEAEARELAAELDGLPALELSGLGFA